MNPQISEMTQPAMPSLEMSVSEQQALEQQALEKLRQQFDAVPYPNIPLEKSPQDDPTLLYIHDLTTAYYLRHRRVVNLADKLILDAGCGSGYKALALAYANPGAKIIGIDLSEASVKLARERVKYHGFDSETIEFHAMVLEDLPQLGLKFDYINCDEVLYLLPDAIAGLQAMKAVLQPDGLIRTNLHHAIQRQFLHNAQALFKGLGLMDRSPHQAEHQAAIDFLLALKDGVALKARTWNPELEDPNLIVSTLAANHLLLNDKGFMLADMFQILAQANLEFVSMVNWQQWEISNLFHQVPAILQQRLQSASVAEKLRIFELINPVHRLMDFWCAHPAAESIAPSGQATIPPASTWSDTDWRSTTVYLHPQLKVESFRSELIKLVSSGKPFTLSSRIPMPAPFPVILEGAFASMLLPLWEGPQPIATLVDRFLKVRPVHPVTLEPISPELAEQTVQKVLSYLERFLYVLLERSTHF